MVASQDRLRVALVAGTLGKGGAEKQLVMMVDALQQAGADVHLYCLTRGEYYERALQQLGCDPIWFGKRKNSAARVLELTRRLQRSPPHVVQAAHFYVNPYVAIAARLAGAMQFGCLRNDATIEVTANGRWGKWLIQSPRSIIANSELAKQNARGYGIPADRVHVLSNVIDIVEFDRQSEARVTDISGWQQPTALAIGRLVPAKRIDRFIRALDRANQQTPINGMIIGDGSARANLESLARQRGLLPHRLRFLGWRNDIPGLLRHAQMLVTSSDHEGFPNVLLESMAAGVPAVGMPAGDVGRVIIDGETGFVVPFDDIDAMSERMVQLATDTELRRTMGRAARTRVVTTYGSQTLAERLLQIYRCAAPQQGRSSMQPLLSN